MGKYLDIAKKFEAKQAQERTGTPVSGQQSASPIDYRGLYAQTAE